MDEKTDDALAKELRQAKLKFLRRAGEFAPDSAVIAINSIQRDFEIKGEFSPAQRMFAKKLIKTSQSLRTGK